MLQGIYTFTTSHFIPILDLLHEKGEAGFDSLMTAATQAAVLHRRLCGLFVRASSFGGSAGGRKACRFAQAVPVCQPVEPPPPMTAGAVVVAT